MFYCRASGQSKPYASMSAHICTCLPASIRDIFLKYSFVEGDCYAHAINGTCNKSVLAAKGVEGGVVTRSLKKLREVGTYTKKSSVGLKAYIIACRAVHMTLAKIPTPAKTRFTSVSSRSIHVHLMKKH